jgi:hypothetical protein
MPLRAPGVVRISASNTLFGGTVRITGGNNITVGSDASGVTISGANTAPSFSGGISNLGNTAGSTGVTGTRMVIVASNNLTASQSTDANGATVTLNAQTGAGQFSAGVSNLGTTAGSTGITGSRMVLAGAGALTLSQSTDANGATVSVVGPGYVSYFGHNTAALYSSSTSAHVDTSVSVMRIELPDPLSFSRVEFPVSVSLAQSATANTAAMNLSATMVLYSRAGSTLNPIVGQVSNTVYTWASNTGVYSSLTGPRMLTFNLATALSPGEYYAAVALSTHSTSSVGTATTALRGTISPILGTSYSVLPFAEMSAATNVTSLNLVRPMQGMYSISISATNQTLQQSALTQTGAPAFRANGILIFRNS